MKMIQRISVIAGLLIVSALNVGLVQAAPSAQQVVQSTTDQLLKDLTANKALYKKNPQAFYDALNKNLGAVVDADGISRSIMTVKYSKTATPAQMQRFSEAFKKSLMQFYGNALLAYDNQTIVVLPSKVEEPGRESVGMEIHGAHAEIYPISYTMVDVNGNWMLRNVIVNGINIGKLFRDQFDSAMQANHEDLDKTIDSWVDIVAKAKQGAQ